MGKASLLFLSLLGISYMGEGAESSSNDINPVKEEPKTNEEIQLERNAESLNWFDSQQGWRENKKQNSRIIEGSLRKKELDIRRQGQENKIQQMELDRNRLDREIQRKMEEDQQREIRRVEQQRRDDEIRKNH